MQVQGVKAGQVLASHTLFSSRLLIDPGPDIVVQILTRNEATSLIRTLQQVQARSLGSKKRGRSVYCLILLIFSTLDFSTGNKTLASFWHPLSGYKIIGSSSS